VSAPGLPGEGERPVFEEPWQAQAFALAVQLQAAGAFSWAEWTDALAHELARPDRGGAGYYERWVAALEGLVASRGLAPLDEIERRKADWAAAYRRTPHGSPVVLA